MPKPLVSLWLAGTRRRLKLLRSPRSRPSLSGRPRRRFSRPRNLEMTRSPLLCLRKRPTKSSPNPPRSRSARLRQHSYHHQTLRRRQKSRRARPRRHFSPPRTTLKRLSSPAARQLPPSLRRPTPRNRPAPHPPLTFSLLEVEPSRRRRKLQRQKRRPRLRRTVAVKGALCASAWKCTRSVSTRRPASSCSSSRRSVCGWR